MFLKEVYRHSKWMFAGMLFFMAAQLAINFKKGMVFSPFFHYGMYSGKATPMPEYRVNLVLVNGDTLSGSNFTPPQWDKIHYTLQQVLCSGCDSIFFSTQVNRLHQKAGLWSPNPRHFINEGPIENRIGLYKKWLAVQTGKPGAKVEISQGKYRFTGGRFIFREVYDTVFAASHLCN